jgi:hypothetical protein
MAAVEEKSMVPTVMVGIGGTGVEALSRVRRLIEESYGSLITTQTLDLGSKILKTPPVVLINFLLASGQSSILNKKPFFGSVETARSLILRRQKELKP